jgi:hypothetical protein
VLCSGLLLLIALQSEGTVGHWDSGKKRRENRKKFKRRQKKKRGNIRQHKRGEERTIQENSRQDKIEEYNTMRWIGSE